ncbi:MAG: glycosyltransferase family 9 protein [Bacteroidetes bacterium]|nr:glycosyltransferase family 9 protein [Bacteroidota bacterium]
MQNPKTILVVQIGKIGDMILTTPLFSGLRTLYPHSRIISMAGSINKDVPLFHKDIDEVLVYSKNILKNIPMLKYINGKIDLWIDTKDNYSRTGELLLNFFKPVRSLGFCFENKKKIFDTCLNDFKNGNHATDINISPLNFLSRSELKITSAPSVYVPEYVRNKFSYLDGNDGEIVLINVSAGSKSRYINTEAWTKFVRKLKSEKSFTLLLTGLEKDQGIINFITENSGEGKIKFIKTDNILETAEVVRRSSFVITPDTSVVHLCSAYNKPIVAVYPDVKWNLEKFYPLCEYSQIIISGDKLSLSDINNEMLENAFYKLLKRINSGNAESRTRVRKEDH